MKGNKHLEFLKSIRLLPEEKERNDRSKQRSQDNQAHNMTRQEEMDLQKELEKRFDELFGAASDN